MSLRLRRYCECLILCTTTECGWWRRSGPNWLLPTQGSNQVSETRVRNGILSSMTKAFYPTGYIAPISTCETIGWNGVEPPVKWKLFTRNEEPMPPLESFHTEEYDSKEAALEAAYQMMYG